VLNLVLNSILIPAFGLNGAAFGSTISFSLISIFTVILFKEITKTRYRDLLLPRRGDFKYYGVFLQKFRALSEETKEGI
jgi:O-antigen/teichoic acid export membrane protein